VGRLRGAALLTLLLALTWFSAKFLLVSVEYLEETTALLHLQLRVVDVRVVGEVANITLTIHNPTSGRLKVVSMACSVFQGRTLLGSGIIDFSLSPVILGGGSTYTREVSIHLKRASGDFGQPIRVEAYILLKTSYHGEVRKHTVYPKGASGTAGTANKGGRPPSSPRRPPGGAAPPFGRWAGPPDILGETGTQWGAVSGLGSPP